MSNYNLFALLTEMERMAAFYPCAEETLNGIKQIEEKIESKNYRIAVIGEFKRGKSSLINALIGADILPTDILPTTAVINKIIYGIHKKIRILFADGSQEIQATEKLSDYATKESLKKRTQEVKVDRIIVEYPSVFLSSNIEVIDTPGMNDDEEMTDVTLGVLTEINAAVVTISAHEPLSTTEQHLVERLIEQEDIYHVVFAITFIDDFSEEQTDRIVSFIKSRLRKNCLENFIEVHIDEEELVQKAHDILDEPIVWGISSYLALESFKTDDAKKFDLSRFGPFKKELFELVSIGQERDVYQTAFSISRKMEKEIQNWINKTLEEYSKEYEKIKTIADAAEKYNSISVKTLSSYFQAMDDQLALDGWIRAKRLTAAAMEPHLKKQFIKNLSVISKQDLTNEKINNQLQEASEKCINMMSAFINRFKEILSRQMYGVLENYSDFLKRQSGFDDKKIRLQVKQWNELHRFPEFKWIYDGGEYRNRLTSINIIVKINDVICKSIKQYDDDLNEYIASWRMIFLNYDTDVRKYMDQIFNEYGGALKELNDRRDYVKVICRSHIQRIKEISGAIGQLVDCGR